MEDVAAAAGVGKGTLYRRFGDKSGLAAALLDEREQEVQAGLLSGSPPLGPGAPAADRVRRRAAGPGCDGADREPRCAPAHRAHRLWRQHCRYLPAEAGAPEPDVRADALLAALTAEQVRQWVVEERRELAELTGAVDRLARSLAR